MNIYKMPLSNFQVNHQSLNTSPDEWSKFVTDVKLVKDLHTTNVDQLHAYLQQHERHANEVRLMHERNSDPLALVASHQLPPSTYQSHLHTLPNSQLQHHVSPYPSLQFVTPYQTQQFTTSQSTPLSITYPSNEYQSSVHHNVYSPQSSIPQLEYAPTTYQHQQSEFSQPDSGLIVPVFQKGDDPIDAINHMMSFLTAVVTSWGDKLLMLLEQRENTLLEQVEATQGNNGLSSVNHSKGEGLFPSSVLCPKEKGMKRGSMIKNGSDALTEFIEEMEMSDFNSEWEKMIWRYRDGWATDKRMMSLVSDIRDQAKTMVVDEGNESSDAYYSSFIDEPVNVNGLAVAEDPKNIDPKFNVKQRMTYIRHDPSYSRNAMEPVLGMRFEHPKQLKLILANYGVANGYQFCKERNGEGTSKSHHGEACDKPPQSACKSPQSTSSLHEVFASLHKVLAILDSNPRDGWLSGCKKVIELDGCFLEHTYRWELLIAMRRDANNQIYAIPWAVVKVENNENWCSFLALLHDDLNLQQGNGLTVISDSHKGLLDVVSDRIPNAKYRKCIRHVFENLKKKLKGVHF
ncbi:integrase, catalytic region, zinc finger, CCHC-type containing protein [Tanacetum coccineum]